MKFEGMTFWRQNKPNDMHEKIIDTKKKHKFLAG